MKAAVVTEPGRIEIQTVADPDIGPRDVLIEVGAVGICGTDLHTFAGHLDRTFPAVLGHEFSGTVVAVGTDVARITTGDRVAVDPLIPCGECVPCHRGRRNLCERKDGISITRPGGMAELVAAPATNCAILPDGLDVLTAALAEPVSCVVHALDLVTPGFGERVGVYGAGPIGLLVTSLLSRVAGGVSVIDLNTERLPWASRAGATAVGATADEVAPERGFDLVVDCTGAAAAIEDGIRRLDRGGTFLQFGVPREDARISISPMEVFRRELRLIGSNSGHNSFALAVHLLAEGAISPDVVISDRFALDDAGAAFAHFAAGKGRKIQIIPTV